MCFGIRILSPFHLANQIISIQNPNCPKNAKKACADMIFISVTFCSSPQGQKAEGYDLPWDLVLLLVLVLGDLRQGGLDEVALH